MRAWFGSAAMLSLGILKRGWPAFVLIALDIGDVWEEFVEPNVPRTWPEITAPDYWIWLLIAPIAAWAIVDTYHDEIARREEVAEEQAHKAGTLEEDLSDLKLEVRWLKSLAPPQKTTPTSEASGSLIITPGDDRWTL